MHWILSIKRLATGSLVHDYHINSNSTRLLFAYDLAPLDVAVDGDTDLSMAGPLSRDQLLDPAYNVQIRRR